jgi:fumarylpyruvate hydrolase
MIARVIEWAPRELAVSGGGVFPARHVWCVGRNYAEHAREMGADPAASSPIFFSKPATALVNAASIDFPPRTQSLQHEVELVVFLKAGGRDIAPDDVERCIFGHSVGVDLTRRDVQSRAKQAGHPWELSKGFDQSAPVGLIRPWSPDGPGEGDLIELQVNGMVRQQAVLGDMIWPVGELLARLSAEVTLHPGDVVFTGTPAGVADLAPGDRITARIGELPELGFAIGQPGNND